MKRPPANPLKAPAQQPTDPQPDKAFGDYLGDNEWMSQVNGEDFPEPKSGPHVPLWVHRKLALKLMAAHGHTGHVIPHRDIPRMNSKRA